MFPWLQALLVVIALAAYLAGNAAYDRTPAAWELVAVAALAALLNSIVLGAADHWRRRRRLAQLMPVAAALTATPDQHNAEQARRVVAGTNLAPLWEHVEALAVAYRTALAHIVVLEDKLERTTGGAAPNADDLRHKSVSATHIVVGSSRHRLVARIAPNLNFIATTQALCRFLGRSNSELTARSILDVIHPDDAEALRQSVSESLRDGEAHNVLVRALVPSGPGQPNDERFLQMDVMTCYNEAAQPINLRCHFLDVTDRIQAERELRRITLEMTEANERLRLSHQEMERLKESYRDLYHHAPILYFSLDIDSRLVAFNETFLRHLGYPREQLLNQPYRMLLPPEALAAFLADPGMMQRAGDVETQWVRSDGSVIDVWIGITTIREPGGKFIRSRSAARDVTETNRLAYDLHIKAEELARTNAQLRRTNQELEEFSYVVSHDLKEPLRTLEAFSNFLAADYGPLLGGEGQEYISHLVQASRRLGRLIDDLLTLSRTGRVIHSPRPFEWRPVIDTVLSDLRDLITRKQAKVRVEGELPACLGDPARVMQLLANLISNGLKYNHSPEPEVVVGARRGPAADHVTLFVRDNGIGIDPRHHEQVFRIFRRLHHRDEVEGTGAGLAICRRIVEAHGGRIWIESRAGEGATFLFTLPLVRPGFHFRRAENVFDAEPALPAGR